MHTSGLNYFRDDDEPNETPRPHQRDPDAEIEIDEADVQAWLSVYATKRKHGDNICPAAVFLLDDEHGVPYGISFEMAEKISKQPAWVQNMIASNLYAASAPFRAAFAEFHRNDALRALGYYV